MTNEVHPVLEFIGAIAPALLTIIFLFVIIGGFITGFEDGQNKRKYLNQAKADNPQPLDNITNSDGKPDLPFDPK